MNSIARKLEEKYPLTDTLSDEEQEAALGLVIKNGITAQGMVTFTTGIFLADFALRLGASNFHIGLLSATRIFCQTLQIPAVYLVERLRNRRGVCVYSAFVSRFMVLVIALIPFFFDLKTGLYVLFLAIILKAIFASIVGCSWNSWMKDMVPHDRLGQFFGKRLFYTTLLGMVLTLGAGLFIDWWMKTFPQATLQGYSLLYLVGFFSGMLGVYYMSITPEPRIKLEGEHGILTTLKRPFENQNYRNLLIFSMYWNFAVNLAAPFFTVFLLKRLEMSMFFVVVLSVLSQLANLMFFRIWGNFADRFSNKAVIAISGVLYILTTLAWTYTTFPEKHFLTIPLLVLIHLMLGISSAGVTLATGNIGLKLAPQGGSTSFMASLNFVNSLSAGLGPFVGGLLAEACSQWKFSWDITWGSAGSDFHFPVLSLSQLDFLFFFSFFIGLYGLRRLAHVKEAGKIEDSIDVTDLIAEVLVEMRAMSTMGGLRYLGRLPIVLIFEVFKLRLPKSSNGQNTPSSQEKIL
jgi:MFS family permease